MTTRQLVSAEALTEAYLEGFAASGLAASKILDAVRPSTVDTSYTGRSLSRPVFLSYQQIEQLGTDLEQLHAALTGLPQRVFGGNLIAFAQAVGITKAQIEMVLRGTASAASKMSRADMYLDEQGFRVLEMNYGAALGGLDSSALNKAMLRQPFIGEFIAQHGLGYIDPLDGLAQTLFTECGLADNSRPVVALADWPESFVTLEQSLYQSAAVLAPYNIEAYPCHVGQLRYADGRVWLGERAIDVVYRLFLMEDLLDPAGPALIEPVLRAAERGEVAIFTPMDADLYGSKGALALLSDEQYRQHYRAEELSSLDRILPWTRMIRPGPVSVGGRRLELLEHALHDQSELLIKPTMLHGGLGVVPGWQTGADEWRQQLEAAMDGPYVLQRRIHPTAELFPADVGPQRWWLNWGAFLGSRGYGGMYLRGVRDPDLTVNINTGATGTCCFHPMAAD
ncbi:MAG TPA: hypothetical protein VFD94_07135 [Jatrophihabitans sp.]|nr:hypothetical protein [Jatrophihabitans sp.]